MTDAEIIAIRDEHLPSQGEPFDCLAFARSVLAACRARTIEECAQMCEQRIPKNAHWTESDELELCAAAIRALLKDSSPPRAPEPPVAPPR